MHYLGLIDIFSTCSLVWIWSQLLCTGKFGERSFDTSFSSFDTSSGSVLYALGAQPTSYTAFKTVPYNSHLTSLQKLSCTSSNFHRNSIDQLTMLSLFNLKARTTFSDSLGTITTCQQQCVKHPIRLLQPSDLPPHNHKYRNLLPLHHSMTLTSYQLNLQPANKARR